MTSHNVIAALLWDVMGKIKRDKFCHSSRQVWWNKTWNCKVWHNGKMSWTTVVLIRCWRLHGCVFGKGFPK